MEDRSVNVNFKTSNNEVSKVTYIGAKEVILGSYLLHLRTALYCSSSSLTLLLTPSLLFNYFLVAPLKVILLPFLNRNGNI